MDVQQAYLITLKKNYSILVFFGYVNRTIILHAFIFTKIDWDTKNELNFFHDICEKNKNSLHVSVRSYPPLKEIV